MSNANELLMVGCERCGKVHTGRRVIEGPLRLVGRSSCTCGGRRFSVVEDAD